MAPDEIISPLSTLPAHTPAYLKYRKTLGFTPAELNLLGLRSAPVEVRGATVLLKCSYRSTLNDKRRDYGMEPLEPEQTLPWGEWEVEDAVLKHVEEGEVVRYLRYYDNPDALAPDVDYVLPDGQPLTRLLRDDIVRYDKKHRRYHKQRFATPIHLVRLDSVVELYTLTREGVRDIDIIGVWS